MSLIMDENIKILIWRVLEYAFNSYGKEGQDISILDDNSDSWRFKQRYISAVFVAPGMTIFQFMAMSKTTLNDLILRPSEDDDENLKKNIDIAKEIMNLASGRLLNFLDQHGLKGGRSIPMCYTGITQFFLNNSDEANIKKFHVGKTHFFGDNLFLFYHYKITSPDVEAKIQSLDYSLFDQGNSGSIDFL